MIAGMAARDRLIATLGRMGRIGVEVDHARFNGHAELWAQVRDLREELRAFDGQLSAIEDQARLEVRRRTA